jgi:hypothetical protein
VTLLILAYQNAERYAIMADFGARRGGAGWSRARRKRWSDEVEAWSGTDGLVAIGHETARRASPIGVRALLADRYPTRAHRHVTVLSVKMTCFWQPLSPQGPRTKSCPDSDLSRQNLGDVHLSQGISMRKMAAR